MKTKRGTYGKKSIKVSVYFYTNDLPKDFDKDKTAWEQGTILLNGNKDKKINSDTIRFNFNDDFLMKFNELLSKNGIKLIKPTGKFVETELN
ncbi:MAG: hypothetical protein Q7R95_03410 [bacterium]|nr:hypothetical protein [bacterium]